PPVAHNARQTLRVRQRMADTQAHGHPSAVESSDLHRQVGQRGHAHGRDRQRPARQHVGQLAVGPQSQLQASRGGSGPAAAGRTIADTGPGSAPGPPGGPARWGAGDRRPSGTIRRSCSQVSSWPGQPYQ
ncbi:hypothetical protein BO70DRAFT_361998, partial [Aspergillus heteromorphus CBS 117.55]